MSQRTSGMISEACEKAGLMGREAVFALLFAVFFLFCAGAASAGEMDEIQQKNAAIKKMLDFHEANGKPKKKGFSSRVSVFSGYETNAKLDTDRKGDCFRGVSFSSSRTGSISRLLSYSLRYDLYSQMYGEATDNSYLLNNVSAQLSRKMFFGFVGAGSDLAWIYYPSNAEGDFFYPRGFVFLRHNVTKRIYQQWDVEVSLRSYRRASAIDHALSTYQDNKRFDSQAGASYQIVGTIGKRMTCFLKGKFLKNESNSLYQDYYDYSSWRGDLGVIYKLTARDFLFSGISLTYKTYSSRLTVDGSAREESDLYSANVGLKHLLTQASALFCSYRYLQNVSNEPSAQYTDSIVTMNWAYSF